VRGGVVSEGTGVIEATDVCGVVVSEAEEVIGAMVTEVLGLTDADVTLVPVDDTPVPVELRREVAEPELTTLDELDKIPVALTEPFVEEPLVIDRDEELVGEVTTPVPEVRVDDTPVPEMELSMLEMPVEVSILEVWLPLAVVTDVGNTDDPDVVNELPRLMLVLEVTPVPNETDVDKLEAPLVVVAEATSLLLDPRILEIMLTKFVVAVELEPNGVDELPSETETTEDAPVPLGIGVMVGRTPEVADPTTEVTPERTEERRSVDEAPVPDADGRSVLELKSEERIEETPDNKPVEAGPVIPAVEDAEISVVAVAERPEVTDPRSDVTDPRIEVTPERRSDDETGVALALTPVPVPGPVIPAIDVGKRSEVTEPRSLVTDPRRDESKSEELADVTEAETEPLTLVAVALASVPLVEVERRSDVTEPRSDVTPEMTEDAPPRRDESKSVEAADAPVETPVMPAGIVEDGTPVTGPVTPETIDEAPPRRDEAPPRRDETKSVEAADAPVEGPVTPAGIVEDGTPVEAPLTPETMEDTPPRRDESRSVEAADAPVETPLIPAEIVDDETPVDAPLTPETVLDGEETPVAGPVMPASVLEREVSEGRRALVT
jgi:hypothetical protein